MYSVFGIVESKRGWYQLIHLSTLQCISSGPDLSILIRTMRKYILEYRTEVRIERRMRELLKEMPIGAITIENTKKLLRETSGKFDDIIHEEVDEVMKILRENNSPKKLQKRKKLVPIERPKEKVNFIHKKEPTPTKTPVTVKKPRKAILVS